MSETGIIATQNTVSHPLSFLMKTGSPWIEAHRDLIIGQVSSPANHEPNHFSDGFPSAERAYLSRFGHLRDPR